MVVPLLPNFFGDHHCDAVDPLFVVVITGSRENRLISGIKKTEKPLSSFQ
jgi:hypothetical protein